jgi:hypothetical protein
MLNLWFFCIYASYTNNEILSYNITNTYFDWEDQSNYNFPLYIRVLYGK